MLNKVIEFVLAQRTFVLIATVALAVFDRMLHLMCQQHGADDPLTPNPSPSRGEGRTGGHLFEGMGWLEFVQHLLNMILQDPPAHPEFHALQYTFLSQISHRQDFRRRLADLYAEWRSNMVEGLKRDLKKKPGVRKVSLRTMATLVQAILHGLAMQKAADPKAINTRAIVHLCLDMLSNYLWAPEPKRKKIKARPTKKPVEVPNGRNRK